MEKKEDKSSFENVFKKISYSTGLICAKVSGLKRSTVSLLGKTKESLADMVKSFKSGLESSQQEVVDKSLSDKVKPEEKKETLETVKRPLKAAEKKQVKKKKTSKAETPKLITFSLTAPEAKDVYLAGDFNQWQLNQDSKMRLEGDLWIKRLELKPGCYRYRFVVDGSWLQDPENPNCQENTFGSMDSLLDVKN